jgi:hypothetical protein
MKVAILNAPATLVRPVAAVIVFTFIGRVLNSSLHPPLFKTWARGCTRDASGECYVPASRNLGKCDRERVNGLNGAMRLREWTVVDRTGR